jgi:hypothetical protein
VDGLTKAIQGGLMTPNEARARESLSPVPHGDRVYVQQQMVELGTKPPTPPPPAPPAPPTPPPGNGDAANVEEDPPATRSHDDELEHSIAQVIHTLTDSETLALLRRSVTETERAIERAKTGARAP